MTSQLVPKQALYQAELRPEASRYIWERGSLCKIGGGQSEPFDAGQEPARAVVPAVWPPYSAAPRCGSAAASGAL